MTSPGSPADRSRSSWIDGRCDEFEQAWRAERQPRIEDFVAAAPEELRGDVLRELVAVEIELRRVRGDKVRREEYLERFPESIDWLDAFTESFQLVAPFPAGSAAGAHRVARVAPTTAATSARFVDLRFFRAGGLGALYSARDEALHREVLVKFMNERCAAEPELIAQFQIEAEITSRLDHPGIVPVYGAGKDERGRPFYVMRLVHGRELTEAIREFHAPASARRAPLDRVTLCVLLEHLANVCNTTAYAHHVGIIHCDLKPANIMIGKYGETFVLDWGLAASFERSSTFVVPGEATVRPRSGPSGSHSGRRGGTYGYISPEQLAADGPIGPASDVYSLGATLYEILTGQPPFQGSDPDVREKIRLGRFAPPREREPALCPRLDAICRKALALDPLDRYATAKLLADDLMRWMRDEAIAARPDTSLERLARAARRHRVLTAALLASLVTILIALAWTDRSRRMAEHERQLREKAEQLRAVEEDALAAQQFSVTTALDTFEDLCRPLANGELSNLGVFRPLVAKIEQFTAVYLERFEQVEAMRLHTGRVFELRGTVSRVYSHDTSQALEDLRRAEAIYRGLPTSDEADSPRELRLALVRLNQGRLLLQRDEYDAARRALASSVETLRRLLKSQGESPTLLRHLAEAHHGLGEVELDRPAEGAARSAALLEAENQFDRGKELRERLVADSSGDDRRNHERDLARSLGYLGDLYLAQGDVRRAADAYEQSKTLREGLWIANPHDPEQRFQYARGLANFGYLELGFRGRIDEALLGLVKAEELQRKLTDDFDEVENFWIDLGSTEEMLAELRLFAAHRHPDQAAALRTACREATERAEEVYGRLSRMHHPRGVQGLAQNAVLQAILARDSAPEQTRRLASEAIQGIESLGREPRLTGEELVTLALARSLAGDAPGAWRALEAAVARGENTAYRFEQHAALGLRTLAQDPRLGPEFRLLVQKIRDGLRDE